MNLSIRPELSRPSLPRTHAYSQAAGPSPPATSSSTDARLAEQVKSTMKQQFADQAKDPKAFHALMQQVYGAGYDQVKAEGLRQKALAGDFSWLPPVEFVDSQTLGGANGAYNAKEGVVYINKEMAARDPKLAASTFVEEAGAHLDTMLNKSDTVGDEGEMLRRLMSGEKLSRAQVDAIKADDDRGTITVNGKEVAVEFWNPFKAIGNAAKAVGKAIGGAAKAVGKAVGGAIKSTAGAIKDTFVNVGKNLFRTGATLFGGIGKMTFGFAKNLFTGHVGDAFKSLTSGLRDVTFGTLKGVFRTGFTAIGDVLKVPTHLLPDSVGSKIRSGIDKAKDHVVKQSVFATELFARILMDLPTAPINNFIGDLESAVKKGLSGDFKGLAKGFGSAFANIPGSFKDRFLAIFDTNSNDIQSDL